MKRLILTLLHEQGDQFLSGQEISKELGISRTAVWKHIKQLQQQGYQIETGHKKGYRFMRNSDSLLPFDIEQRRTTTWLGQQIIHMETVSSTNLWAKEHVADAVHGTIIVAEEQTQGRGRRGRTWSSSRGEGLWLTMVLRPDTPMWEGAKITQIAAVAMHQAVSDITDLPVTIKWPNDLMVADKKICGILTEMTGELNRIENLFVGVGVNINQPSFEEELEGIATSLYQLSGEPYSRLDVLMSFLAYFQHYFDTFHLHQDDRAVLKIIREHSSLLGKPINVIQGQEQIPAVAIGIHDDGRLEVEYPDGKRGILSGGEVSVRRL